ncbi:MAG: hypothetical protein IPG96_03625 [Proteobacteria bacterium]|nr:hypothetical protein [Pseudomonadota bacterium]
MNGQALLTELEGLAQKLEVEVVYDHFGGDSASAGGLCKVRGRWRVMVERHASPAEKASVIARSLGDFDLEQHYVSPAVRQLIERRR